MTSQDDNFGPNQPAADEPGGESNNGTNSGSNSGSGSGSGSNAQGYGRGFGDESNSAGATPNGRHLKPYGGGYSGSNSEDADNNEEPRLFHIRSEQNYLAACLLNNEWLDLKVEPDDFIEPIHSEILKIARRLRSEGRTASVMTVAIYLLQWPDIAPGVNGEKYLGALVANTVPSSAPEYVHTIREFADRRAFRIIGDDVKKSSVKMDKATVDLVSEAVSALDEVLSRSNASATPRVKVYDAVGEMIKAYQNPDDCDHHQ